VNTQDFRHAGDCSRLSIAMPVAPAGGFDPEAVFELRQWARDVKTAILLPLVVSMASFDRKRNTVANILSA
jgi:hypothetical protein